MPQGYSKLHTQDKAVGEFICDDIITRFPGDMVYDDKGNLREEDEFVNASCLSFDEILDYAFNGSSNNVVYACKQFSKKVVLLCMALH